MKNSTFFNLNIVFQTMSLFWPEGLLVSVGRITVLHCDLMMIIKQHNVTMEVRRKPYLSANSKPSTSNVML